MKKMTQISSYLGVLVILLFTTTAFKSENSHKNLTAQNANEITVLFAYTTNAAFSAGGAANIKRNVDIGLKNLNDALKNSNVSYSVRAIDEFVEVEYNNTAADFSSVDQLLKELRKVDGKFNKVHQFRKQKQADIVCLIFGGYGMGYADLNGEMMVCNYEEGIFGGSYIFPHEFAHNLGATHEAAMLFDWKEAGSRRTLEGNGAVAIPYFSEDRTITMDVAGAKRTFALGDASHDNAKTIRKNAPAKSKLGENLGNVAASNNALAAKLVNPLSVQAPQGPVYSITAFSVSTTGKVTIKYQTADDLAINVKCFPGGGTSPFGDCKSSLDKNKNEKIIADYYAEGWSGDKFVLYVGGKEVKSYNVP